MIPARNLLLSLSAAAALVSFQPDHAAAQAHCQSDVPRETHPYAYQFRGDRCEGSCGRLTSNTTALRVVGFSRGPVLPSSEAPGRLAVRWILPAAAAATLRVSAVVGPYCYQMDSEQPPFASGFSWSSGILREVGIPPDNLAALVWTSHPVGGRAQPMIVPVEPQARRMADDPFVVRVIPTREFASITFSLTRADDGRVVVPNQSLPEPWYPEDEVVEVELPAGIPRGVPLRLSIVGGYEGGSNSTDVFLWVPR